MTTFFESPDGGKTVYTRESGCAHRTLNYVSPAAVSEMEEILLSQERLAIRHAAKENAALQNSVNHLIMLYRLIKNGNSET